MFSTLWSYLTRFGRLALVAFAAVIVLVLVIFTFNSIGSDDDQAANGISDGTSSTTVEEGGSTSGDQDGESTDTEASSGEGSDSSDSTTVSTTGENGETDGDSGHVSSTNTNALPDTGPNSVVVATIGLMALSASVFGFRISRQNLSQKLLESNR